MNKQLYNFEKCYNLIILSSEVRITKKEVMIK